MYVEASQMNCNVIDNKPLENCEDTAQSFIYSESYLDRNKSKQLT